MKRSQVLTTLLTSDVVNLAAEQAKRAEIGGRSHVRGEDRGAMLSEDQLVGQLGTLAGHLVLFGSPGSYLVSRWFANLHPTEGDGGSDVPGANIDFKASLMRASDDPMRYRLAVRQHELHRGTVYFLILLKPEGYDYRAYFVGWATDKDLPDEPDKDGVFAGAYTLRAEDLHPFPPFRWFQA